MALEQVLRWGRLTGPMYGTEQRALFLYSIVRMSRPVRALELGTGLGASAFCMAQAMRDNGEGHVWSVDNGQQWGWDSHAGIEEVVTREPAFAALRGVAAGPELLDKAAALLGLNGWLSLIHAELELIDTAPVDAERHPFLREVLAGPIDLLFSDINSRPEACLLTLRKYLPKLADCASVFFDSASTYLPSYLALERTVEQLGRGKLPAFLLAGATRAERERLHEIVATRRFSLVHLTERDSERSSQNSMAWLRIEPENIVPYPLAAMRGMLAHSEEAIAGEALEEYLRPAAEASGR